VDFVGCLLSLYCNLVSHVHSGVGLKGIRVLKNVGGPRHGLGHCGKERGGRRRIISVRYDKRYFRSGRPTSTIPSSSSVSTPFSLPPLRLEEETLGVDGSGSVSDSRENTIGAVSIEGRLGVGVFSRASLIGGCGAGSLFGGG